MSLSPFKTTWKHRKGMMMPRNNIRRRGISYFEITLIMFPCIERCFAFCPRSFSLFCLPPSPMIHLYRYSKSTLSVSKCWVIYSMIDYFPTQQPKNWVPRISPPFATIFVVVLLSHSFNSPPQLQAHISFVNRPREHLRRLKQSWYGVNAKHQ